MTGINSNYGALYAGFGFISEALRAQPKALVHFGKHFTEQFADGLLLLILGKLPPYGRLFLAPAEGCSLRLQQWGHLGPTIGPFGPT